MITKRVAHYPHQSEFCFDHDSLHPDYSANLCHRKFHFWPQADGKNRNGNHSYRESGGIHGLIHHSLTTVDSFPHQGNPDLLVQLNTFAILALSVSKVGWKETFSKKVVKQFWLIWLIAPLIAFIFSYFLTSWPTSLVCSRSDQKNSGLNFLIALSCSAESGKWFFSISLNESP